MEENKIAISKYKSKNPRLDIIKTKNNAFFIRDGIVSYCVKSNPLSCPCVNNSTTLCNHKIFLLNSHYGLNFIVITFIHKLLPNFSEGIANGLTSTELNDSLTKIVYDEILTDECGICVEKLGGIKTDIAECNTCKKYCHKKCLRRWLEINKKNNVDKKCVYCNTGEMLC